MTVNTLGEALLARSKDCPYCAGLGLVTLYDRLYRGAPVERHPIRRHDGEVRTESQVMRCVTYCLCPLGVSMRARTDPETHAHCPDLAAVLEGRTRWTTDDPTCSEPHR